MKQLVILSGKGGTGKTCVAAAFAHLAAEGHPRLRAVLADADVDASNLELVLEARRLEAHAFAGGAVAGIDPQRCSACGRCWDVCRFEAVVRPSGDGVAYAIDPLGCEGCAACFYQCPEQAIQMTPQRAGYWFRSASRYGPLYHAALNPAQENSGKLVTLVKQQARLLAIDTGAEAIIVDGPPGIGCPVISAASGADLALIVAEPTAAGIHDMVRVLATTTHFRIPALVCINKADIYDAGAEEIEAYCRGQAIPIAGRIPFDMTVTEAVTQGKPVTAFAPAAPASVAVVEIWESVAARLMCEQG
jgi:MinD superfamily P-loop ATPase